MVTDEERDYMFTEYAKDPRMKRNIGIGRRLASLVDNGPHRGRATPRAAVQPSGQPHGDEIGMGDNIYLGDRDGVRTPMRWTPDRNAGFSKADFAQLYLPPLMDPVYGFQVVNVEAQLGNSSSFLHWIQRMLTVRRAATRSSGPGAWRSLPAKNPSVLAFIRQLGDGRHPPHR